MKINLLSLPLLLTLLFTCSINPKTSYKEPVTKYTSAPSAGVIRYMNDLEKNISAECVTVDNQYAVGQSVEEPSEPHQPQPKPEPQPQPEPTPEPASQPQPEPTPEPASQPQPTYSDDDLYLLSHIIAGEANNSDETMKAYVGSVVLNRVKSPRFPSTLKEVIFQKGQYSCVFCGYFKEQPNESTIQIAKQLLTNGPVLPPQVVFQAEFKQGSGVYIHYQNEYFCCQ
jgi:spore germination cell wall hydrolase CwlJ-like protein